MTKEDLLSRVKVKLFDRNLVQNLNSLQNIEGTTTEALDEIVLTNIDDALIELTPHHTISKTVKMNTPRDTLPEDFYAVKTIFKKNASRYSNDLFFPGVDNHYRSVDRYLMNRNNLSLIYLDETTDYQIDGNDIFFISSMSDVSMEYYKVLTIDDLDRHPFIKNHIYKKVLYTTMLDIVAFVERYDVDNSPINLNLEAWRNQAEKGLEQLDEDLGGTKKGDFFIL